MIRDDDITEFVALLLERLRAGEKQYGNSSFKRPLVEVIGEVEQELLDVSGWSLIAWTRLRRLRERIARIEQGGLDGQP